LSVVKEQTTFADFLFNNSRILKMKHLLICRVFLQEQYYPFSSVEEGYIFSLAEAGKYLFVFWLFFVRSKVCSF